MYIVVGIIIGFIIFIIGFIVGKVSGTETEHPYGDVCCSHGEISELKYKIRVLEVENKRMNFIIDRLPMDNRVIYAQSESVTAPSLKGKKVKVEVDGKTYTATVD